MNKQIPVGLAYAYLKGQWSTYERHGTSRTWMLVKGAQGLFNQAVALDKSFLSRRLNKQAREEGML